MRRVVTEEDLTVLVNKVRGGVDKHIGKPVMGRAPHSRMPATDRAPSPYRSKWEEQFAYELTMEKRAGMIKAWAYEDMTFKLSIGKYHRPDFLIWHLDGSIEIAQVKGYHKNLRASLTALKWAAQQRPWFRFTLNRRDRQGWLKERVQP